MSQPASADNTSDASATAANQQGKVTPPLKLDGIELFCLIEIFKN